MLKFTEVKINIGKTGLDSLRVIRNKTHMWKYGSLMMTLFSGEKNTITYILIVNYYI